MTHDFSVVWLEIHDEFRAKQRDEFFLFLIVFASKKSDIFIQCILKNLDVERFP